MNKIFFAVILLLLTTHAVYAQARDTLFAAFWNVENLFDTINDPQTNDEDFLPEGKMKWDSIRFDAKIHNLAKVISEMNGGKGPALIGLAEVENKAVVEALNKLLLQCQFDIAHLESPDERGIDVALLYNKSIFTLLSVVGDTVLLPDNNPTRLVLRVGLRLKNKRDLYVFVNHFPSRRGGEDKSEINRRTAAEVLRKNVFRLLDKDAKTNVLIIGDFNDEPTNKSLHETLGAKGFSCDSFDTKQLLFNLAWFKKSQGEGTFKYRDNWNVLDQIIVSSGLMYGKIKYLCNSFDIFKPGFLVTQSGKYAGAPAPTYGGERYLGGFSDHFPVTAKFLVKKKK